MISDNTIHSSDFLCILWHSSLPPTHHLYTVYFNSDVIFQPPGPAGRACNRIVREGEQISSPFAAKRTEGATHQVKTKEEEVQREEDTQDLHGHQKGEHSGTLLFFFRHGFLEQN